MVTLLICYYLWPASYTLPLILPFFVFPLCACTHLVRYLFLMLHCLSGTVSLAKLDHQTHSHLSNLASWSYPIDCMCQNVWCSQLSMAAPSTFFNRLKTNLDLLVELGDGLKASTLVLSPGREIVHLIKRTCRSLFWLCFGSLLCNRLCALIWRNST